MNEGPPKDGAGNLVDGGLYPMRLVTRLTGLSADTIRAWERRYNAIEPRRSAGNTRRFSSQDVRRLILLREATARGHAISSVAQLGLEQLETLVGRSPPPVQPSVADEPVGGSAAADTDPGPGMAEPRQRYLEAVERFASRDAYEILMRAATFLDRRALVFEMILPIARSVGQRWSEGRLGIAQEHMVSAQLRSVLSSMLRLTPPRDDAPQVILSTPPGHRHELGILVAALLGASRGLDPLYLGPDLPFEELEWAVRMSRARVVVLSVARELSPDEAQTLPAMIAQLSQRVEVWIGLPKGHLLSRMLDRARVFHALEAFDDALEALAS